LLYPEFIVWTLTAKSFIDLRANFLRK